MASQDCWYSRCDCLTRLDTKFTLALIGVFDSGVGGLSILDEALRQLPQNDFIYLADSVNAPYGEKSSEWIAARSLALCTQLLNQGCDAIVVACNTATAEAIQKIRESLAITVIGVEPGIKPAAMQTKNGIVGVLATEATLKSDKFNALLATLPSHCQFIKQAGAGLVPLIEAGKADSPEALELLAQHLELIQDAGADTLVLGCTHYPFLRNAIRKLLGESINLIDTSEAVVRQLKKQLESQAKSSRSRPFYTLTFISSKDELSLLSMANELMASDMSSHRVQTKRLSSIR